MDDNSDEFRVNPSEHRGRDVGILERHFVLPRNRDDHDYRGPRTIRPRDDECEDA